MYKKLIIVLLSIAAHQAYATIKKVTTMSEYESIAKGSGPCVVVFNSDTCSACESMEKDMTPVTKEYPTCLFYSVNASEEAFKDLDKKKLQIKAWPTTHFIKGGKVVRNERGAMGPAEIDKYAFELVNGKPKPAEFPKKAAKTK